MGLKKYHLYPDNMISLNNFLTLGTVLGAILIGIGSNSFAKKQLIINEKSVNIEMAMRYKDHYCELCKELREILLQSNKDYFDIDTDILMSISNNINGLSEQAELLFDKDIVDANIKLRDSAFNIYISFLRNKLGNSTLEDNKSNNDFDSARLKQVIAETYQEFVENQEEIHSYLTLKNEAKQPKLLSLYLKHTKILREAKL